MASLQSEEPRTPANNHVGLTLDAHHLGVLFFSHQWASNTNMIKDKSPSQLLVSLASACGFHPQGLRMALPSLPLPAPKALYLINDAAHF